MTPDQLTQALTQALVQGGSTWLIATIVAFLPVLWTMTLVLHLGRPYVLRTLRRCGLRLGADIWWMTYLLLRDALIVLTFALSWVFFQPNIVANNPLPLTGPIAALCLLLALAVKMVRRVDDDLQAYRLATVFLVLGATLYYLPQVFGVEAASQVNLAWFANTLVSNANPVPGVGHHVGLARVRRAHRRLALRPRARLGQPDDGQAALADRSRADRRRRARRADRSLDMNSHGGAAMSSTLSWATLPALGTSHLLECLQLSEDTAKALNSAGVPAGITARRSKCIVTSCELWPARICPRARAVLC